MINATALVVLAAGRGERFGGLKQLAPAGPNGETLMDYSIHHALAAGFDQLVVVVRAEIEEAVRGHLERTWASRLPIEYVTQPDSPSTGKPGGTVDAVLSARSAIGDGPLAVTNADDLYGRLALDTLHTWLTRPGSLHAVVGFPLVATLLPDSAPVTRAICERRPDGTLAGLVEAAVERRDGRFVARPLDGTAEVELDGSHLVSMNAFGFRPSIWPALDQAAATSTRAAAARAPASTPPGEARLPSLVAGLLDRIDVALLPVADRCIGLTWPEDLEVVKREVRRQIDAGDLPARLRSPA